MAEETKQRTTSDSIAAVPTLHSMSSPLLTQPADVGAYLINMMFANPGSVSSTHEDEMLCFRKLMAKYSNSPDALGVAIAEGLTHAMEHYFPKGGYSAVCTVNKKDGVGDDGAYLGSHEIVISIVDANSLAIVPRSQFEVDGNGALVVHYGGTKK